MCIIEYQMNVMCSLKVEWKTENIISNYEREMFANLNWMIIKCQWTSILSVTEKKKKLVLMKIT